MCIVVSDISPAGSMADFQKDHADRFLNVGVAEQSMIGIAPGSPPRACGRLPTRSQPSRLPSVRDGSRRSVLPESAGDRSRNGCGDRLFDPRQHSSHQEDIAVAGAIPNMQILTPCDPAETREMTKFCALEKGTTLSPPWQSRGTGVDRPGDDGFEFGKIRTLRQGSDICIMAHGAIMSMALEIADDLEKGGASVSVANVHTLKPIDREGIARRLKEHRKVIVIEEHAPIGGLATHAKSIAWDEKADCDLHVYTLSDAFIHCYGSHEELRSAHGLDKQRILANLGAG